MNEQQEYLINKLKEFIIYCNKTDRTNILTDISFYEQLIEYIENEQ